MWANGFTWAIAKLGCALITIVKSSSRSSSGTWSSRPAIPNVLGPRGSRAHEAAYARHRRVFPPSHIAVSRSPGSA